MNYAIIPAAGLGLRFGGDTKKQFLKLHGRTLLEHTLERFHSVGIFEKIVVCLPADELQVVNATNIFPTTLLIEGGATRAESVYRGFKALNLQDDDLVLIHDAVRPLVSSELIQNVVSETQKKGAVIPGLAVSDTIKRVNNSQVEATIDRSSLVAIQTPQGFQAKILKGAYQKHQGNFDWTDEAMLVERAGVQVTVVEGEKSNIKVTTPFDLRLAKILQDSPTAFLHRSGQY